MTTLQQAQDANFIVSDYLNHQPGVLRTPKDYGAVPGAESTTALQAAFDDNTTEALVIDDTYMHSSVLHARHTGLVVQGPGTLLATNESASSVWIEADDITFRDLTLQMGTTTKRWGALEQHKLTVKSCARTFLSNVQIVGSAAAGVFTSGGSFYTYDKLSVSNTRADGIHNTYGSHDGVINNPTTYNTGDDAVAVVSYVGDNGAICYSIAINSPRVMGTAGGRGCSVVGGQGITYKDVYASGTAAAGIYVASESNFNTLGVDAVTVSGATLDGCNWNKTIDHGAVNIYNGQPTKTITNVIMNDILIRNVRATASNQVRMLRYGNPAFKGIQFNRFTLVEGTPNLWYTDAKSTEYTRTNWVYNNVRQSGT